MLTDIAHAVSGRGGFGDLHASLSLPAALCYLTFRMKKPRRMTLRASLAAVLSSLSLSLLGTVSAHEPAGLSLSPSAADAAIEAGGELRWWKGNTHTHSWWSDGNAPPEVIAAWYRDRGYNFLVFSDHNRMQSGVAWHPIASPDDRDALDTYVKRFGEDWVERRTRADGVQEVKLKTLDEFRTLVERPGAFALIRGLEITDRLYQHPVHINSVNVDGLVLAQGGDTVVGIIQNNIDAVHEHQRRSGRPVFAHLNHPNFQYAVTADDLIALDHAAGEGFLEIYNGHSDVRNEGDESHPSVERMWDIVLAKRLGELGRSVVYGIASDDAHHYTEWGIGRYNPGRGWLMVRSTRLTPDSITAAIKRGDFYASTGVQLRDLTVTDRSLALEVEPEAGVEYVIEFVGTRHGTDLAARPALAAAAGVPGRTGSQYSDDIGAVLMRVEGTRAMYTLRRNDIYVRARVVSTKRHPNPNLVDDVEMAWTQPLVADGENLDDSPMRESPSSR